MKEKILEILRCQQCLGKLSSLEGELVCGACKIAYPISHGLIFMGYDRSMDIEIKKIIASERDGQTDLNEIQKHYDFAFPSYMIILLVINILKRDINKTAPVAIDIGSGGTVSGMLLSENGFDTYRCELDPNSLYSGLFWKHPGLGAGKHIACDATILPFKDNSVDVVFCKEFVHHIHDHPALFTEVARILKRDGVFLMIEPTSTLYGRLKTLLGQGAADRFGHHYRMIVEYFLSLGRAGFTPYRYYAYGYAQSRKLGPLNTLKKFYYSQIASMQKTGCVDMLLKTAAQCIYACSNVVFLKKSREIPVNRTRPPIRIIETSQLILDDRYLNDRRLSRFAEILLDCRRTMPVE